MPDRDSRAARAWTLGKHPKSDQWLLLVEPEITAEHFRNAGWEVVTVVERDVLVREIAEALREEHARGPYDPQHFTPKDAAEFILSKYGGES